MTELDAIRWAMSLETVNILKSNDVIHVVTIGNLSSESASLLDCLVNLRDQVEPEWRK